MRARARDAGCDRQPDLFRYERDPEEPDRRAIGAMTRRRHASAEREGHAVGYLLQHLLSDTADRLPSKEAVRSNGTGITYDELERRTNQVARTLQHLGVQRGDRVGLYVHKSMASVI